MSFFNLLEAQNIKRDIKSREKNKKKNVEIAKQFGFEYFDGTRDQGYGGYKYDGRWKKISKKAINRYKIKKNFRILDIGCAKGFFVHDLCCSKKNIDVFGIDISDYALKNCHPDVVGKLHLGDARNLPFPDNSFDLIFSINVIHNFNKLECKKAIKEMIRVSRNKSKMFIQVDAYENKKDLELFKKWVLTAKTCLKPKQWKALFAEVGYTGDYYWTILKQI